MVNWEESVIDPSESLPEIIELETPVELPTIEPVASLIQSELLYVSELGPAASLMTSEVSQKQESQEGTSEMQARMCVNESVLSITKNNNINQY